MWVVSVAVPRVLAQACIETYILPSGSTHQPNRTARPAAPIGTAGRSIRPSGHVGLGYHPGDVRTDGAGRRAARDHGAGSPRHGPCRSPPTCAPARASRRPSRPGMAHFLEHLTFKGTAAYPSTRALSEAVEGVGGSFNAATDREATVYWVRVPRRETERAMTVLGELICRPSLDLAEIDREREVIVEEIRGYLDDPAEYAQILFQQAMFGRARSGREICGEEADVRALPADGIRDFWAATYRPANAVGRRSPATSTTTEAVDLADAAFGRGNGAVRGFEPAPALPAGARILTGKRDTTQAQLCLGVPGAPARPPRRMGARDPERDPRRRDELAACSCRSSIATRSPTTWARGSSSTPTRARSRSRPGSTRAGSGGRSTRSSASSRRSATSRSATTSWRKAKAYLSGGLELRMEETRHLASWIGGQEALHDRVLTLDEALAAIERVTAADVSRLAGQLFRNDALRLSVVAPGRSLRGLDRHLRLPGMTVGVRRDQPPSARTTSGSRASTSGSGQLTLARAELEDLLRRDALDAPGLAALAEARWRTGDAAGAADAAFTHLEAGGADDVALCIAAEAAASDGRADGGAGPDGPAARSRRGDARRPLRGDAPARLLAGRAGRPERSRRAPSRAPMARGAGRAPRRERPERARHGAERPADAPGRSTTGDAPARGALGARSARGHRGHVGRRLGERRRAACRRWRPAGRSSGRRSPSDRSRPAPARASSTRSVEIARARAELESRPGSRVPAPRAGAPRTTRPSRPRSSSPAPPPRADGGARCAATPSACWAAISKPRPRSMRPRRAWRSRDRAHPRPRQARRRPAPARRPDPRPLRGARAEARRA